jgi:LysR family transcriptional activator of nhaA
MQNINLNSLFYFWEISKAGSLKKAAVKLHLTQPSLSHQLKSLENSLGAQLFNRVGRSLSINKNGELVQEYCNKIFGHVLELENLLALKLNQSVNSLKIGVLPSISKAFVYNLTAPYLRDDSIKLLIKEDNLKYLLRELEDGELDVIVTDFHLDNIAKSLIQKLIHPRSFLAVCNPSCKLEHKSFPKSLTGLKFVNYTPESVLNDKINHYFSKNKIVVRSFTEVDDIALIKEIILNQPYAAILPSLSVQKEIKEKRLIKLGAVTDIKSNIYVLVHDDNTNPTIKKFNYLDY